jgi:hypothetical protein
MVTALVVSLLLATEPGAPSEMRPGAVVAPAALPPGTLALYGLVGAPEVGAGYRQGIGGVELEAKALFNLFELSGLFEGGIKVPALRTERLTVAPGAAVGATLNSGSKYFDGGNFGHLGLRLRGSLNLSYAFSELLQGVAQLEMPLTIPLTVQGISFTTLLGAGAEFNVGGNVSVLGTAHLGVGVVKEPLGVPQTRAAWGIRLGVGYRLF